MCEGFSRERYPFQEFVPEKVCVSNVPVQDVCVQDARLGDVPAQLFRVRILSVKVSGQVCPCPGCLFPTCQCGAFPSKRYHSARLPRDLLLRNAYEQEARVQDVRLQGVAVRDVRVQDVSVPNIYMEDVRLLDVIMCFLRMQELGVQHGHHAN